MYFKDMGHMAGLASQLGWYVGCSG